MVEEALQAHMTPDQFHESQICNIYYDTPDYRLVRHSLEKPVYKEKLRLRSYGQVRPEDPVFLEMKKKYKGIVYKRRIRLPEQEATRYMADPAAVLDAGQIGKEIDYFKQFYGELRPVVYLSYSRLAWKGVKDPDLRLTLDQTVRYRLQNLTLTAPVEGELLLPEDLTLMEIKTPTAIPLWLVEVLSKNNIRKQSFSKYGTVYQNLLQNKSIEIRGVRYV